MPGPGGLTLPGVPRTLASLHWVGVLARRLRGALPEGDGMPKIVVTAAVKDVEAWLKSKPELIAQMPLLVFREAPQI